MIFFADTAVRAGPEHDDAGSTANRMPARPLTRKAKTRKAKTSKAMTGQALTGTALTEKPWHPVAFDAPTGIKRATSRRPAA